MNNDTNYYKKLLVWQKSMDLVEETYRLIKFLPSDERFALADQMRRSAVSIVSNIAEGAGRKTKNDFIQFLSIARGSKYELETQFLVCIRLNYFNEKQAGLALQLCSEIGKMLNALIKSLSVS
ncbi:four helix bundle protein [Ruminococcus flavefaciens]|uniref:four helix bundle protein n=1 Tax=Ruminococcus flavefaciens TaxID=1265 RepID=UPI0026EC1137|nr:four helix bundle protein [Ruminococcus flavefaciens]